MFERLKQLFAVGNSANDDKMTLELVTAALLLEVCKSDFQEDPGEIDKIRKILIAHFSVSIADIDTFMAQARNTTEERTDLYPFTRYINDNCNNIEKYQLVSTLWEVALEDGRIDKYEDHLIRKISDLIYLPHSDFIRAKLSVIGDGH
ncbi:TerB family tellurite resistance protein [Zhongshania guokunii]|uniref:TerB family tellurite resistance protein n=1 Tax=Zhongshania guokunii TaxID=641783 RepID=A0ABV3U2I4_9GAMM